MNISFHVTMLKLKSEIIVDNQTFHLQIKLPLGLVWSPFSQGTLKSLLHHCSSKTSILQVLSLLCATLSLYVSTGKAMALTIWIFVGEVMSLFFNILSRCIIAFLPRSKSLLISWLQSLSGGASGKDPACHCRRHKKPWFDPWVKMIPWRRKWQPSPVFLPGEFHAQRSLAGYSP